ncbi:MAG: MarR family transcriptional regulator [Clostridia bacterium]|nr:MarR family transcriptional regulator [Clostridia bacterium]
MESLHYLLMKAHTNLQRNIIAGAAELGLSPGQPKILDYLSGHEGSDQKTIAAYCEIEQTTVGSILTRMEKADLIERRQKDGNRRSIYIYLTEKGRRAAEKMESVFKRADELALKGLTEDEAAQLKYYLNKICTTLTCDTTLEEA